MIKPAFVTLRLTRIQYAAAGVHLIELRAVDGSELPPFQPGAHVDLHLPGGLVRQYSLCNAAHERERYVVAVKRDPNSRGGSAAVHERLRVGDLVSVGVPRCHFALDEAAPFSLLIAGGIGITPIACMVQRLRALGRPFALFYSVRRREEAALLDLLAGPELILHVDEEQGGVLDVPGLVAAAPPEAAAYCCGPAPMLDAFELAAQRHPGLHCRVERFVPANDSGHAASNEGGFRVRLSASGRTVVVSAGQTILAALRDVGITVPSSCERGICGACETRVLGGEPDHRDSVLSYDERRTNKTIMVCCSGSLSAELVLDL